MAAKRKTGTEPADAANLKQSGNSKSARTRERILDAAAHVLSRNGFAGTRLADIAEFAELQAPAIYYYFSSREDLIEEVMWVGLARMCEHVQASLDELPAGTPPLERILAAVESHIRYELEISDYTTAAIRNSGQLPENIRARQAVEENRYGEMWRQLFDDAQRAGVIRADLDVTVARLLVLGALNWAAEWWNPRRGTLESVVRTAQSMVRHGIAGDVAVEATEASAKPARAPRRMAKRTVAAPEAETEAIA